MATKRFIITEQEDNTFVLVDKKDNKELFRGESFEAVHATAKTIAEKNIVYGITNIIAPESRHIKFKNFKTPIRCAYEFN